jgi:amino acid adenylation domain-containing protein
MHSWVDETVNRILALSPRKALEIGCGTGLLLFRIATHTSQYYGTDVSPRALSHIEQNLSDPRPGSVVLSRRPAEDFTGIEPGAFDTVILNSVVQYFPDLDYLLAVLTAAVKTVKQGSVFLGDIRNLRLLEAFHASVVLANAPPTMTAADCRRLVQERIYREEELFVDPDFFYALKQQLPEISGVEIQLKRGAYQNELTRFRYDVVLHIGTPVSDHAHEQQLDWQADELSVASLQRLLKETTPASLRVTRVPNLRVARELQAAKLLADGDPALTVAEIIEGLTASGAVDPEDIRAISELPYQVAITWSEREAVGGFDVVFTGDGAAEVETSSGATVSYRSLREFANDPLQGQFARKLVPTLRSYLKENLPDYMVPATFVLLDKLPLTPNGKIDRRALPALGLPAAGSGSTYIAPRTPTEELVASIWMRVLGVEQLGVEDNFFELGGHSLVATQIVTRVRSAFKIELPLRLLFDKPTVAALSVEIDRVIREEEGIAAPPITRVAASENLPLSFAQQRLWFLDQLTPNNPFYNMQLGIRFSGELNVAALAAALNEICRRHEVFRTSFQSIDGDPIQIISPPRSFALDRLDLSTSGADPMDEVTRLARAEAQRPFDLTVAPLVRFSLFQTADDEHVLLTTMHHIISDGWSLSIFVGELSVLYRVYHQQKESPLPELPIQYSDFARWQKDWLQGDVLNQHLDYWKKQLAGIPPTLDLLTDRPRPVLMSYRGARRTFTVRKETSEALKSFGKAEGLTLFMNLLAAWLTLLSRYSGQEDIVVGTPMANRNQPECEGLIGFFVDMLVLRGDLSGDPTFRTLMGRVRETALGAYAHQNIPFEKLVDELHPQRDTSRNPLFQVMFTVNKGSESKLEMPGLTISPIAFGAQTTRFDLECQFNDTGHELRGAITYNTDLFDAITIQHLVENFEVLLTGIAENPDRPLSTLPLLTPAEERRLLSEWNETATTYRPEKPAHALFEEQVVRAPESVAVVYEDTTLNYRELNIRANKLAHYLRSVGVGPDVQVAICLERSINKLVAVLGVMKAGAAYVPLDPDYPAERLAFMIEDSRSRVLLTEKNLQHLPSGDTLVVCIDQDWDDLIEQQPEHNPDASVSPENLSYVIYTSGSTGNPKGVSMPHVALANLLDWQQREYPLRPGTRVLQFSAFIFDAYFHELSSTWADGGALVLTTKDVRRDPIALWKLIRREAVERIFLPFVALQQLAQTAEVNPDLGTSLKEIFTAGEQLEMTPSIASLLRSLPAARLYNHYGPSESHVVTAFNVPSSESEWMRFPPIGRPIANTQIYLLDHQLAPVPAGVRGELYIGGISLSRCYLEQPEMTAERFVPNPFTDEPGSRLYRTGDMARYLPQGDIEFLGRRDNQVKIRGFRIETPEIESSLRQHAVVREAVVTVREDSGEKRLVAYLLLQPNHTVTTDQFRTHLQQRLPDYMIPSTFVVLDRLPLTASGKVDRRQLPAPGEGRPDLAESYVAPRTPLEQEVARIWEQVLKVKKVGVHDNFFDLGGNSMAAVRLMAQVHKELGPQLPLSALFQRGTIEHLASLLQEQSISSLNSPIVTLQSSGTKPPLFFIHAAGGNVFSYLRLAQRLGSDQPVYGVQALSLVSEQESELTMEEMAASYVSSIVDKQPEGPYFIGGWSFGGVLAFEVARQLQMQGRRVGMLALIDSRASAVSIGDDFAQDGTVALMFARDIGVERDGEFVSDSFGQLAPEDQLRSILRQAKRTNTLPPDTDFEQILRFYNVYRANLIAWSNYRPGTYSGPVVLYRADDRPVEAYLDPKLGWTEFMSEEIEVQTIPGGHYTLLNEPNVTTLALALRNSLDRAAAQLQN